MYDCMTIDTAALFFFSSCSSISILKGKRFFLGFDNRHICILFIFSHVFKSPPPPFSLPPSFRYNLLIFTCLENSMLVCCTLSL